MERSGERTSLETRHLSRSPATAGGWQAEGGDRRDCGSASDGAMMEIGFRQRWAIRGCDAVRLMAGTLREIVASAWRRSRVERFLAMVHVGAERAQ